MLWRSLITWDKGLMMMMLKQVKCICRQFQYIPIDYDKQKNYAST